jgi:hypothetical protein
MRFRNSSMFAVPVEKSFNDYGASESFLFLCEMEFGDMALCFGSLGPKMGSCAELRH